MTPQSLLGGMMMISGIAYLGWSGLKWLTLRQSESWPSTTGTVIKSEWGTHNRMIMGSPNRTYQAKIAYKYRVGERDYFGTTLNFGGDLWTSFKQRAEEVCADYPEGKQITVYYNPKHPQQACLERSEEAIAFAAAVSAGFVVLGWLIWSNWFGG